MVICKDPNCKREAIYNNEGENPLYCGEHKLDQMVDVKTKRCEHGKK